MFGKRTHKWTKNKIKRISAFAFSKFLKSKEKKNTIAIFKSNFCGTNPSLTKESKNGKCLLSTEDGKKCKLAMSTEDSKNCKCVLSTEDSKIVNMYCLLKKVKSEN